MLSIYQEHSSVGEECTNVHFARRVEGDQDLLGKFGSSSIFYASRTANMWPFLLASASFKIKMVTWCHWCSDCHFGFCVNLPDKCPM